MSKAKDDLISREAAIEAVYGEAYYSDLVEGNKAEQAIRALPSIEATPVVHARWIERRKCYPTCSLCGRANRDKFKEAPYCHCGAKMDAKPEEVTP